MSRDTEFAALGVFLRGVIDHNSALLPELGGDLTSNLVTLNWATASLARIDVYLPAAVSLLVLEYPLQVECPKGFATMLALHSFDFSFVSECRRYGDLNVGETSGVKELGFRTANDKTFRDAVFPTKNYGAASVKVNVRLGALARAYAKMYSVAQLGQLLRLVDPGTHNDQVCSFILYAVALEHHLGQVGRRLAAAGLRQPNNAKGLSNALKALGLNTTFPGCLLVEMLCLQGRGCTPTDLKAEAHKRVDPSGVAGSVIPYDDELGIAIDELIDSEIPEGSGMEDCEEWWSKRWLWCVNGSQNRQSDALLGLHNTPKAGLGPQRYRRMAAEEVIENPIYNWDGYTSVSYSDKLECGKNRAIFACDTRSYFAFSWVLGATQRVWRNQRIILDPGAHGYLGLARRLLRSAAAGGINLMLDYDDFNSHHSTETMQHVFKSLCRRMGAPDWYRDKLVNSFERMYVTIEGNRRRVLGTLMSGHRGTTFLNSVLNAAYIRRAVGRPYFDRILSLHAGDDVYMRLDTLGDCVKVLRATRAAGCRMNPSKQSIGYRCAEFLRMGLNPQYAVGYIARAIPSLVCGNWTNDKITSAAENAQALIANVRTLLNRGMPRNACGLLSRCLNAFHSIKNRTARELLEGRLAIEGSPLWSTTNTIRTVAPVIQCEARDGVGEDWGCNATNAYLSRHLTKVELEAINLTKVDPRSMMLQSSYLSGVQQSAALRKELRGKRLAVSGVRVRPARGVVTAPELLSRSTERGVLAQYPVLQLIKNRLTDGDLHSILSIVGLDNGRTPIREFCFGPESSTKRIVGALPYSDAASLGKRTSCDTIMSSLNVFL